MNRPTDDDSMIEDYLDCAGRKRRFRLSVYPPETGLFLDAIEILDGEPVGQRFVLPTGPDGVPRWGDMRDLIRRRLSRKDVVRDEHGELHILAGEVNAQITDLEVDHADGGLPRLIVGDLVIGWEDLGRLLMPYTGFKIRLEIHEDDEG